LVTNRHLRFISWIAVSSKPQSEKESLEIQRRLNHEFVAELSRRYPGYSGTIIKELEVVGSRSIIEIAEARKSYQAYATLIDLIRKRAFDALIVRSRDRLGREGSLILTIERLCWQNGIVVVPRQSLPATLDVEELRDSEGAYLIGALEGHFARSSVRRLVNESLMGRRARVEKKKLFAGTPPWGYRYRYDSERNEHIEVDPEAAEIIRTILVELFTQRQLSYPQIAATLNERGLKTSKGKPWTHSNVRNYVKRADPYGGYLVIFRESKKETVIVHGSHEPILTQVEWEALLRERERREYSRNPPVSAYANVVYCTATKKKMIVTRTNVRRESTNPNIFVCNHCPVRHTITESAVARAVRWWMEIMQGNMDADRVSRRYQSETFEMLNAKYNSLRDAEIASLQDQGKILDRYICGYISDAEFDQQLERNTEEVTAARSASHEVAAEIENIVQEQQKLAKSNWLRTFGIDLLARAEGEPIAVGHMLSESMRVYVSSVREKRVSARVDVIALI